MMKKLKLFFACLLMAVLSIGQMWAETVEFTPSNTTSWNSTQGSQSQTLSGITLSSNNAANNTQLRLYSGGTHTFTSTVGNITSIVFTCTANGTANYGPGKLSGTGYTASSGKTGEWTGSAAEVTISGGQARCTSILVTYTPSGGDPDPSVSLSPSSLDLDAENVANQSVTITASNFASAISSVTTGLYSDAECATPITSGAWVKDITVNAAKTAVTFNVDDNNTGVARECWLKVSASDGTGNASAAVHVAQKKIVVDYATLPFSFTGGKADIENIDGMTQSGLGSDYSATEKLKFDGTGDWLKIKINADPGKLSYRIKGNSFSGGTFTIQQSADDETYSDLATYTADGSVELTLAKTTRYVKFIYTSKSSGNIGLGNIAISLPVDVEAPTISGVTPFLSSTEVTLTQNDADAIYYTTDEAKKENPSVDTWTEYNSASKPSFNATTTIYAAAIKESAWSAVAEQTFTKATVLTVAEAIALIPNKNDVVNDQYVAGIVCTAAPSLLSGGKLTYYISADGSETNRLQIYKGKNLNNTEFTAVSDLAIGDRVTVFGQLMNFNNTPEMNDGNYLVSKEGPAVAAPEFTPNGGGFMGETDVTITCATGSSTIYYTLDGTNPTKLSTLYEGAIHLDATTTITAIAYVGEESSLVVAKEFTLTAPMTVAEALTALDSEDPINNAAVSGIISTAPSSNPSSGKLTYYISDDGSATDQLEVFNGYGLNGASFSAKTDLQVGDEVTVFGNLTIFNSTTKEFASGSRLLAFNRPVVAVTDIDLTESTAEVEVDKTVTLHASVVPANATNKTIVWSVQSGSDYASVENGVVTGIAAGEAVIRAASDEDATLFAECTVTVTAPTPLSPWATVYTSNVTLSTEGGTSASAAKVKFYGEEGDGYDAIKAGTGSAQGAVVVNVPAGATALHFHAYGWTSESVGLTVTAPAGVTVSPATEISINSNSGIASNSPFTLAEGSDPKTDAYYAVSLSGNTEPVALTISATAGKRFVLFGVNQEGGLVLESIAISGTATELEYNEGDHFDPTGLVVTGHYSDDSEATISEGIDWTFDPDPLTEGTTSVSVTATASGKTSAAFVVDGLTVAGAAPLSPWASVYTSNVTLSTEGGTSASAAKVKFYGEEGDGYDAIKAGTGSAQGAVVVNVPAGATALHFHAYGWNSESVGLTVTAPTGVTVSPATEISINSNSGIASNSPFTLAEGSDPKTDAYYAVSLSGNTEATNITISATSGKRFVLFGVNQEGGLVLESISITGTATALEYTDGQHFDPTGLSVTGHYSDASTAPITEDIVWAFDPDPLTEGTTSVSVTATAAGFTSAAFVVNGLTVSGAAPLSPWATVYTSNVELSGSQNVKVTITVDEEDKNFDGVKMNKAAAATFTIPAGTTNLYAHMAAWNGEAQTVTVSGDCFDADKSIDIVADANISGSGTTYDIDDAKAPTDYFKEIVLDKEVTEPTEITITAASGKRFVLFGVNQVGGVLPVLESIEISGDLSTKTGYKVGDALDLDGLTVEATYSLGGVAQSPVDITSDPELTLTYDPLVKEQTEVTITATYKGQTDDITITGLDPVASADPLIYVSKLNVNFASVEVGDAVPAAETVTVTLTNVASVTATLGGTNADAFSVSPASLTESGDITISILANTDAAASYSATLTISDGAEGAEDKTINLSFAVTEPVVEDDVTGTWTLVTNATTLAAGKKVIIAQYVEADGAINTMAGQASNNRSVIASTVAGATLTPAVGTKVMTLADAGEGHFYLMTSNGEYLYNASTSTKSYLKTKAEEENVSWTIAVDAEGVATITSVENTNRTKMRYNPNTSGSPLFNCYASGQEDIALYMHEDATPEPDYTEVRSGLEPGRYYTVCLPREVVAVKGATFWTLKNKNMEGSQAYLEEETNNLPFAAGKPFIIQATANKLEVAYEGDATTTAGVNGAIHGTLTYMNADALDAAGPNVYLLYQNELRPLGVNNHLDANRAYVKINELDAVPEAPQNAPGRRVVAMPMEKDVTTDINALNAAEAPVKMIIDGNLFILRGEKLYDATGRLVK